MKKILFFILCTTSIAWSTNLKGTVQGYNSNTQVYYPIDRVTVELGNYGAGNRWIRTALSVTDNNGKYYFYGISPGSYSIIVGGSPPVRINVINAGVQEIPAIIPSSPRTVYYRKL